MAETERSGELRAAAENLCRFAGRFSNHRLGTAREHRLSGARLGPVSANLGWTPMHGWQAQIHETLDALTIHESRAGGGLDE